MTRPTYQGRPLPRPEEEIVDQGLAFDLGTLVDRRRALLLGFGAVGAVGLAACGAEPGESRPAASSPAPATPKTDLPEIPEDMAGPFPGDGSNGPDVLEQSGVVRRDIRRSFGTGSAIAKGVAMTLNLTILNLANGGAPYAGAAVYVWHCDRDGKYSMYDAGLEQENYLRGVQVADADGLVSFTSIFPGCYPGRWPHVHFEVYPSQSAITTSTRVVATSQVALPKHANNAVYASPGYQQSRIELSKFTLADDMVFRDDLAVHQMATATGDVGAGYTISLTVPINPWT
ncbi:MAG: intradiol ring-cleavage dioxygenase [Nocardioidaceae bacterium]